MEKINKIYQTCLFVLGIYFFLIVCIIFIFLFSFQMTEKKSNEMQLSNIANSMRDTACVCSKIHISTLIYLLA